MLNAPVFCECGLRPIEHPEKNIVGPKRLLATAGSSVIAVCWRRAVVLPNPATSTMEVAPQTIGLVMGVVVFCCTLLAIFLLLIYGGSFERMRQQVCVFVSLLAAVCWNNAWA